MKLKTIFKKVTAAALAATMVVGMAACGSGSETASSSDSAASSSGTEAAATPAVTDNSKIKIGVSIWSSTDVLGSQCKKILDEAAKALDVDVQMLLGWRFSTWIRVTYPRRLQHLWSSW